MSDTDDTDVLTSIPPHLYVVDSSSDAENTNSNSEVVSEIRSHVESLEHRISVIESACSNPCSKSSSNQEDEDRTISETKSDVNLQTKLEIQKHPRSVSLPSSPARKAASVRSRKIQSRNKLQKDLELISQSLSEYVERRRKPKARKCLTFSEMSPQIKQEKNLSKLTNNDDLLNKSFTFSDTDRFLVGDYKPWMTSNQIETNTAIHSLMAKGGGTSNHFFDDDQYERHKSFSYGDRFILSTSKSCSSIPEYKNSTPLQSDLDLELLKFKLRNRSLERLSNSKFLGQTKLPNLTDYWDGDCLKTSDEALKIKLEEEKFRRWHCEKLIQDLQKNLLEQQEKNAVAVRLDEEKNNVISQFQAEWNKLKRRVNATESENEDLQKLLQNVSDKHKTITADYQNEIQRQKTECLNAFNLANGYKRKSDDLIREKFSLIETHVQIVENYKFKVADAVTKFEEMEQECRRLLKKNREAEEMLNLVQLELQKENLIKEELNCEIGNVCKSLDKCQTELSVVREEKDILLVKVDEETSKNKLLTEEKELLLLSLEDSERNTQSMKTEMEALLEKQEGMVSDLREVYQKQVDETVQEKLREFQAQLDSAQISYENDLSEGKKAIAEIAARKLKSIGDKFQLEVEVLEKKHSEEKRLFEMKLEQYQHKVASLELQLSDHQAARDKLVKQLHLVMQQQWQQALKLISGDNTKAKDFHFRDSCDDKMLKKNKLDNFFSSPEPMRLRSEKNTINEMEKFDDLNELIKMFYIQMDNRHLRTKLVSADNPQRDYNK